MKGDTEIIAEKVKAFESNSNESLIADYNKQSKCGITGVRGQALYIMAMGHVFFKRFGESPIYMEENVLGMRGQIKLSGESFEYLDIKVERPVLEEPLRQIQKKDFYEPFVIESTTKSPSVICDATNGTIEIKGRMISTSCLDTLDLVIEWLEEFAKMPPKPTTVSIQLEYFSNDYVSRLLSFFHILKSIYKINEQLIINWYYEEGDKDMLEAGEIFSKHCDVPFRMISFKE